MDELNDHDTTRLSFEVSNEDQSSVLVMLHGELDVATADELEARLKPLVDEGATRIVADAGDLQFADSSAIALFVKWANVVDEVEIRNPSPLLRQVLKRMGLAERLRVVP
jgi:anti-anti-sigma factor